MKSNFSSRFFFVKFVLSSCHVSNRNCLYDVIAAAVSSFKINVLNEPVLGSFFHFKSLFSVSGLLKMFIFQTIDTVDIL